MNRDEIQRWPTVKKRTGLSRSTVWRLEQSGHFPAHFKISPKLVGWKASEIDTWIESRMQISRCSNAE